MFRSIKWRLTAIFFSVTAIVLFILGFYLMAAMEQYSYNNTRDKLNSYARLMARNLSGYADPGSNKGIYEEYARKAGNEINARVTIVGADGEVLGDSFLDNDSMVNHADRPEIKQALSGKTGEAERFSSSIGEKMVYFAVPVEDQNRVAGVVRVAIPWSEVEAGQSHIRWTIGAAIFMALILTVLVASSFTSSIVIPLQEMTRVAEQMAEGKLETNFNTGAKNEIGTLSRALNYMSERLRDTFSQITEERNKVKAILTSMNDGVVAIDRNGCILLINPAVERMFDIKYENSLGKSMIEVVRNFDLERLLREALTSTASITRELQMLAPDLRTFRVSTAPLTNESGVVGVVAVLRDITAFREVERMKTDFVANVSHELRTPLTSIKGFVETLLDGAMEDPVTARHFLGIINDESDRLNRLIIDLLSLSRIEAKQQEVHLVALDMKSVINNTLSVLSPQANEKKLSLDVDIIKPLPVIRADKDMIGQLLINLVDNAVKYTPEGGGIGIRAEAWNSGVKVTVSDTGIGIPRESMPRLFERFYRVDKARSREMGGTGLGLAIVKHILEVHGGTIKVKSRLGMGSTFTFYLPAEPGK
ncbi:MAG: phosphate regulon sensor histidine kinase PhoR [Firmicutes bacterium HGW-Firmicutes-14]|nr:MAG: phosphate regulon sensor histidine kinase PhoR [Firmicutes bacterium HGW-Firmicutes-14]